MNFERRLFQRIEPDRFDDKLEGGPGVSTEFLGGHLMAEGFDPAEDLAMLDANQLDENINSWALSKGDVQSPFSSSNWKLFISPSANYGENGKHNLLVDVRDGSWINPVLEDLNKYLESSEPRYVVFYISGQIGYCEWQIKFNEFFQSVKSCRSPNTEFATRLSANWMPRYNQEPYRWRGGLGRLIKDKEGKRASYTIPYEGRAHFKHRVWLLEELGLLDLGVSYIELHTDQPRIQGVTGGSDISFGRRTPTHRIDQVRVRIYFRDGDTFQLGFPEDLLNDSLQQDKVIYNDFEPGKRVWVAKNPEDFYSQPYSYLNKEKLANRRPSK